jgi:hypothetical protein
VYGDRFIRQECATRDPFSVGFYLVKTWLLIVLAAACSCAGNTTVAMRPVDTVRVEAVPGEGIVVIVRPPNACTTAGSLVFVDEHGDYVGESAPQSYFAASLSEGDHALYAWDPYWRNQDAVVVTRVTVERNHPAYVEVTTGGAPYELRKTCGHGLAELHVVGKNNAELDDWLRETKPYAADRAAGRRWLDAHAADTQRHVELGARKLEALDERAKAPTTPTSAPAPSPSP